MAQVVHLQESILVAVCFHCNDSPNADALSNSTLHMSVWYAVQIASCSVVCCAVQAMHEAFALAAILSPMFQAARIYICTLLSHLNSQLCQCKLYCLSRLE